MQEEVKSISSKLWVDSDKDANEHNMNRSQFHDFCYLYWKKRNHRPSLVEIAMLLCLALIVILVMVVK